VVLQRFKYFLALFPNPEKKISNQKYQYFKIVSNSELWASTSFDGVYERDLGNFVNGLPTWSFGKITIERSPGGGWKMYHQSNNGVATFRSDTNNFC